MRIDATDLLAPERRSLLDLLGSLSDEQWGLATECPAWTVQGVALHILGDDLSLLARQLREGSAPAPRAVLAIAADEIPGLLTRGPHTATTTTTYEGDTDLAIAVGAGLTP